MGEVASNSEIDGQTLDKLLCDINAKYTWWDIIDKEITDIDKQNKEEPAKKVEVTPTIQTKTKEGKETTHPPIQTYQPAPKMKKSKTGLYATIAGVAGAIIGGAAVYSYLNFGEIKNLNNEKDNIKQEYNKTKNTLSKAERAVENATKELVFYKEILTNPAMANKDIPEADRELYLINIYGLTPDGTKLDAPHVQTKFFIKRFVPNLPDKDKIEVKNKNNIDQLCDNVLDQLTDDEIKNGIFNIPVNELKDYDAEIFKQYLARKIGKITGFDFVKIYPSKKDSDSTKNRKNK